MIQENVSVITLPSTCDLHQRQKSNDHQKYRVKKLVVAKLSLASSLITFDALAVYILAKWKLSQNEPFRFEMGVGLLVGLIGLGVELMNLFKNKFDRHQKLIKYFNAFCSAAYVCAAAADVVLIFVASFCLFDATDRLRSSGIGNQYTKRQLLMPTIYRRQEPGHATMEIVFASNLIMLLIGSAHMICTIASIIRNRRSKLIGDKPTKTISDISKIGQDCGKISPSVID